MKKIVFDSALLKDPHTICPACFEPIGPGEKLVILGNGLVNQTEDVVVYDSVCYHEKHAKTRNHSGNLSSDVAR